MVGYRKVECFLLVCCVLFCVAVGDVTGQPVDVAEGARADSQLKLEEKTKKAKKKRAGSKISREEVAELNFPEDTSSVMIAKELRITGNTLVTTEELLAKIPFAYNASEVSLQNAESGDLYDFRAVRDIIEEPGQRRQISARTIRGLTQCILSVYRKKGYSGIFVSVPPEALEDGTKLRGEVLVINITEAPVTSVTTNYHDAAGEKVEKGRLRSRSVLGWSPVQTGKVGNQKKLEDFVNLLNLNPDRYVSATISKGAEPGSLALDYNVYEANPWHFFVQADNSGTDDRQWSPLVGLINTNLLGFDDRLTVYHQSRWEKNIEDEYSVYANYDFPILGPKLRLNLFGGRNEFDVDGGGGIGFLGHGSVFGGELRYNLFQKDGWFVDITSSLSYEKSKVSSSIFNTILGSEVHMNLWGTGLDIHRRTDMSNTYISLGRVQSIGGSPQREFWNAATSTGARVNADNDFTIYRVSATHKQYLDTNKIGRVSGSLRWIIPDERLVPAKMTTFGGMYSVRGYKESKIVADGGTLISGQYEFDLVKYFQSKDVEGAESDASEKKPFIRKLAPLVFFDWGQARIRDAVAGETGVEELYSAGPGMLVELGDNFSGAVYYGYPLESTDTTHKGEGRFNFSVMMRW